MSDPHDIESQLPDYVDREAWRLRGRLGDLVHKAFESFDLDWWVVARNVDEVEKLVAYFKGDEGMRIVSDGALKHSIHVEAVRRLANFLTSGRALIDHADRKAKQLARSLAPHVSVGSDVIAGVMREPWQQLLRALCDITLHVGHQNSHLKMRLHSLEGDWARSIEFDVSSLQLDLQSTCRKHQDDGSESSARKDRRGALALVEHHEAMFDLNGLLTLCFEPLKHFREAHRRELLAVSKAVRALPIYKKGQEAEGVAALAKNTKRD